MVFKINNVLIALVRGLHVYEAKNKEEGILDEEVPNLISFH